MEEIDKDIVTRDPFLGPQVKSLKFFYNQGPAMQSAVDQESGQPGQVIRNLIRYKRLVLLYANGQIDEK